MSYFNPDQLQSHTIPSSQQLPDPKAKSTILTKYDPFKIPPDIQLAKRHQKAKMVGEIDLKGDYNQRQLCPCCNLPIEKKLLPLCIDPNELYFLGIGYPQYFLATKQLILLIFLVFCIVGIHNVRVTTSICYKNDVNVLQKRSSINGCFNFLGLTYTVNYSDGDLTIQAFLTLIAVIVMIISLWFIKRFQFLAFRRGDINDYTASDYTIMISNIFPSTDLLTIQQYFSKNYKIEKSVQVGSETVSVGPSIERIIFATRIDNYVRWSKELVALWTKDRLLFAPIKSTKDLQSRDYEIKENRREIKILEEKIDAFEKQTQRYGSSLNCPYVFVTFKDQQDVKEVLRQSQEGVFEELFLGSCSMIDHCFENNSKFSKRYIDGKRVYLERAPEPLDICWENLAVSQGERNLRYLVSIFFSLLLIAGGALIIYGISYIQRKIQEDKNETGGKLVLNYFLSFLCSFFIFTINYLLNRLIRFTAKFEKHPSFTSEIKSSAYTLICMQFINTALIPFALFLFTRNEFGQDDLMASLFFIFIGHAILVPSYVLFDPLYLIIQKRKRRYILQSEIYCKYTQMDAHKYFQGPDFDITDKQTTVNSCILISTFYACIFPYGTLFELISLTLYYWVSKYVLLRRCAWPINLSFYLQEKLFKLMSILPLLLAFSGYVFENALLSRDKNISIHIINIILGAVGVICLWIYRFEDQDENSHKFRQEPSFQEQRLYWPVDYDRCNPVTRARAIAEWEQLWQNSEGSKINPIVLGQNIDVLYGTQIPNQNQNVQPKPQQIAPEDINRLNQLRTFNNQNIYVPGNQETEIQRQNMMCASYFMQQQIINQHKK